MYIDMTYRGQAAKLVGQKLLEHLTRIDQLPDNCRRAFVEERVIHITTQEQEEFTLSIETGKKIPSKKVPAITIEVRLEKGVGNPAFFWELYQFLYEHIHNALQYEMVQAEMRESEFLMLRFCFSAPHGQRLEGDSQIYRPSSE